MKKLKQSKGVTLMETIVALVVVVFLIVGMEAGMNAGMRTYSEAGFQSDSGTLSSILNSTMADMLRYANSVRLPVDGAKNVKKYQSKDVFYSSDDDRPLPEQAFVFTNLEYGIDVIDAYFTACEDTESEQYGYVQIKNLSSDHAQALVNDGAYTDDLMLSTDEGKKLTVELVGEDASCFKIHYYIVSKSSDKEKEVTYYVRRMNDG